MSTMRRPSISKRWARRASVRCWPPIRKVRARASSPFWRKLGFPSKPPAAGRKLWVSRPPSRRVPLLSPWSSRSTPGSPMTSSNWSPSRTCWADRLVRPTQAAQGFGRLPGPNFRRLVGGDLVVHLDHGIGRYLGLEPITVGKSQHDCVALEYSGGDKLYIPVENIDVLSRYGSSEEGASLDRLGGEAWQKRPRAAQGTHPRDCRRADADRCRPRRAPSRCPRAGRERLSPISRSFRLGRNRRPGTGHCRCARRSCHRQGRWTG